MNNFSSVLFFIYELIFPRDGRAVICDKVDKSMLEKKVKRVHAEIPLPVIAPLPYKNTLVNNMVFSTKYHSHKRAGKVLGETIAPFVAEELAEKQMFSEFTEPLFVPIPLHKEKEKVRGYNQSVVILESLVEELGFKENSIRTVLIRKKNTLSQTQCKNKNERFNNMKNAFTLSKKFNIKNKDIVLLDDVVTTGATLESAKKVLLNGGARNVLCVAVAH